MKLELRKKKLIIINPVSMVNGPYHEHIAVLIMDEEKGFRQFLEEKLPQVENSWYPECAPEIIVKHLEASEDLAILVDM